MDKDIIEMDEVVDKLVEIPQEQVEEISKAVAIAKETEADARDFYKKVSQKATDPEMKKAMELLSKEESAHYKALSIVEYNLRKQGKFAVVDEVLISLEKPKIYPGKDVEIKDFQNKSDLAALLWAMRAERKAELFYSKQAEKTDVEDIKRFFEELAKFEKGHFDYLDGIVSTMTDTGDFILG